MPGAYVQFLRIDGTELGDPIQDQKEISGPLQQIAAQLDHVIDANVRTASNFTLGHLEEIRPDYPVAAIRQLVRNALIHRNYETSHSPTRLYWFTDRIEIHSPGGPYGQVTAANFGTGPTDYRNPLVAEAMKTLGYVQRFGFGIPTARKLLAANGNPPPEFSVEPTAVLATLRSVS